MSDSNDNARDLLSSNSDGSPDEGKGGTERNTEHVQSVMTLTEMPKGKAKIRMPLKDKIIMGPLDKY